MKIDSMQLLATPGMVQIAGICSKFSTVPKFVHFSGGDVICDI